MRMYNCAVQEEEEENGERNGVENGDDENGVENGDAEGGDDASAADEPAVEDMDQDVELADSNQKVQYCMSKKSWPILCMKLLYGSRLFGHTVGIKKNAS